MKRANAKGEFISWTYGHRFWDFEDIKEYVRLADLDTGLMQNFDDLGYDEQLGRVRQSIDYWISYPGPSELFNITAEAAKKHGKRLLAKMQVCCSHEIATVPYIPVPNLIFDKYRGAYELGVDGIIFPMIRTSKEARAAVNAVKYPPYGERGFGPMNAINYGYTPLDEYLEGAKDVMVFVQIEHKDAIDCLDELMEIDGIDGFVFGPNDLAGSYGLMGKVFSDKVSEVIKDAVRRLHERDKYVVIASGGFSEEIISHWAGFGADMIFAGADFDFVREGAISNRKNIERILGIS